MEAEWPWIMDLWQLEDNRNRTRRTKGKHTPITNYWFFRWKRGFRVRRTLATLSLPVTVLLCISFFIAARTANGASENTALINRVARTLWMSGPSPDDASGNVLPTCGTTRTDDTTSNSIHHAQYSTVLHTICIQWSSSSIYDFNIGSVGCLWARRKDIEQEKKQVQSKSKET